MNMDIECINANVHFREVFVEERNNISNNPLRREKNGKR